MSKLIATAAIRGAHTLYKKAEDLLKKAIAEKGKDFAFEFPDTAFHLPMIYAMTGFKVKTLGDMEVALGFAKELLHEEPAEQLWKPYLGEALDSGMAALFAEEIYLACRYVFGLEPVQGPGDGLRLQRLHLRHDPAQPRHPARRRHDARLRGHHRRRAHRRDRGQDLPRAAGEEHPDPAVPAT